MFDFLPQKPIDPVEDNAIQTKIWQLVKALHGGRPLPKVLYHYTDAGGLKGIVESGTLRATHIAYMNDASEYLHAVSLLAESIREAKQRVTNPLQIKLLEEIEQPVAATRPQDVSPYFVTCFSAQENSLNQWRAYSRGEGGFSIGFNAEKLDAAAIRLRTFFSPAIYNRDDQANLVREFVAWVLDEYPRVASKYSEVAQDEHRKMWAHIMLWRATAAAPIMKNPAFFEEQEWRLIHLLQSKWDVRFMPKPLGLVPFVEHKLGEPQTAQPGQVEQLGRPLPDRLPIDVLWSGPGRATDVSLLAGRTLLEQFGYDGVHLEASKIPYRVG